MVYGAAGCLIVVNYSTGDMRCQYEIGENEKMENFSFRRPRSLQNAGNMI